MNAAAVTQQMRDLFNLIGFVRFGISGIVINNISRYILYVTIPKQIAQELAGMSS